MDRSPKEMLEVLSRGAEEIKAAKDSDEDYVNDIMLGLNCELARMRAAAEILASGVSDLAMKSEQHIVGAAILRNAMRVGDEAAQKVFDKARDSETADTSGGSDERPDGEEPLSKEVAQADRRSASDLGNTAAEPATSPRRNNWN